MRPLLPLPARGPGKTEERQTVPACARDRCRDGAERGIMPALVPESVLQDFHQQGVSFPLAGEQRARQWEAAVLLPTIPVSGRGCDALAADCKEIRRRDQAQV